MEKMQIIAVRKVYHPHPFKGRVVVVELSNGCAYTLQDDEGDYTTGGALTPDHLAHFPEVPDLLQAVGEAYVYWLNGGEDPLALLLRKQSPALRQLYQEATDPDGRDAALPEGVERQEYVVLVPTENDVYEFAHELFEAGPPSADTGKVLVSDEDAETLFSMCERARRTASLGRTFMWTVGPNGFYYDLRQGNNQYYFLEKVA